MLKRISFIFFLIISINSAFAEDEFDEFDDDFESEFVVEQKSDPLESYNRVMTKFNDKLYTYVLKPTAKGYKAIVPKSVREGISNMFNNILYPVRFINNLLQGKFKNSFEETERFVINSTIGLLGFFDVAKSHFNIQEHNEDFGQTLGYYGVKSGPHIVLPILGPSNLRDMFSLYPDSLINPMYDNNMPYKIPSNSKETMLLYTEDKINQTSLNLGLYESIKEDAIDLYPYLRNAYEQNREKLIKE